jgi:Mg-chelatase subunit ChlD
MPKARLLLTALPLLVLAAGCGGAAPESARTPSDAYAPAAESYADSAAPAAPPAMPAPMTDAMPAPMAAAMPAPMTPMAPRAMPATRGAMMEESTARPPAMPRPAPREVASSPAPVMQVQEASVKAGEWDDNANYREFQKWLATEEGQGFHRVDVRDRQFIVVRDAAGKAVPSCPVTIRDAKQRSVELTTLPTGRALFFPHAENLSGTEMTATARCKNGTASARFTTAQTDGIVDLKLDKARALPAKRGVDLAFILDTTGSMTEEIAAVKATIQKVAGALSTSDFQVRIGMVEFKDRTDAFATRVFPMTTNVAAFSRTVEAVNASGGGDIPEDVNAGLHAGLTQLSWSPDAVARFAFLIGDAPPHLDYQSGPDYVNDMRDAAHRGIQVFTVAASGMDELGQVVWRQIAQYTGATNLFVMRGGAGPASTGGGDPRSSCGGTQTAYASGNLDGLIVEKITRELKGLDRNPMRIAGLGTDENAKPCSERVLLLAN